MITARMFARIVCLFTALVVFVHASGDFVLLHTPDSVIFKGNKEIDQSLLKELFSASLGFTVKQKSAWNGIAITSPFNLPEAIVAIAVEGVESLGAIKGKKFPLNVDEVEETTWQALSGRLEERDSDNTLVRIYLGDGLDALGQSALGELKPSPIDESFLKALSLKSDEDRKFLDEVQLLRAIAKKVPTAISTDSKPDVYWLVVSGLKSVFDVHGKNSLAAKEALTLLNEALHDVSKAFMNAYKNQVLIAAFTNDASQVRHTRSILREKRDTPKVGTPSQEGNKETEKLETPKDNDTVQPEPDKINLAKDYDDNYPVIFNIILWFGVVFFFALLAICIFIAEMDPGRDSIIYRMTSNRMKKDN
ncbi:ATPase H(+)-transporting accessory protein 2 isoform X2 [Phymastichus coffea]|uniref:ATPase H(+)-transporting accessory protein 2 isoform X2 n=1 Tax=Phymastichus coffea TaxID=108790 RepID=UPI00273C6A80|nr:ATPase H(+)-transporting accessory protein 2 isoform X2 [Phymastichus coffea]